VTVPAIRASVVIPMHGHAGMTNNCLNHVLQTLPPDSAVEVVIVDDASPRPLTLVEGIPSNVTVVRTDVNMGFAGACNLGAQYARGHYLVFLNNDTEPQPFWLEHLIAAAESRPSIGIVGARLLYPDKTIQHAGVAFSQRDGVPRHLYRGFPATHPACTKARDMQAVTAACMLVDGEFFNEIGGFSTSYVNEYEDIDLCMRARSCGRDVHYCPDSVVIHLESVSRKIQDAAAPTTNPNLDLFMQRWEASILRDEVHWYLDDGLITVDSSDVYPLRIELASELGYVPSVSNVEVIELLGIRARQVFDLTCELNSLRARLLDSGDTSV
jgi:GT2 family glycosyltransferase